MAPSAAKKGFGFTMDLQTNFSVELKAKKDFRLGSLSAVVIRFSRNSIKRDFKYMALYIKFLTSELGGYNKGIFEFRMELYAANVPFKDFIFKVGQG